MLERWIGSMTGPQCTLLSLELEALKRVFRNIYFLLMPCITLYPSEAQSQFQFHPQLSTQPYIVRTSLHQKPFILITSASKI